MKLILRSAILLFLLPGCHIQGQLTGPPRTKGTMTTPKAPRIQAAKREWDTPAPMRTVDRKVGDPPEPIILMHGMAGWKKVAGVDYFNGVAKAMRKAGYTVFATEADPFNSVENRGAQAKVQIEKYMAKVGAKKVHLIGHSQGGLDARHIVASLGMADRVATVTSIGTPHQGTAVSDVAYGNLPGDAKRVVSSLVNTFAQNAIGREADIEAQLKALSQKHCRGVFNPANPDQPGVEYYSYAGKTQANPVVDEDSVDVAHPATLLTYQILKNTEGNNDGLVSVYSATWGTYLGALAADHFDEVGQPPTSGHASFDHATFYVDLAKFLQGDGPAPRGEP